MKRGRFFYGALSVAFTALILCAAIALNVFAGMLTDRFSLKADLSGRGILRVSDETAAALSSLESDVTLSIIGSERGFLLSGESELSAGIGPDLLSDLLDALKKYESVSKGRLRIRFIDPGLSPDFISEHSKSVPLRLKDMVLEGPNGSRELRLEEMFAIKTDEITGLPHAAGLLSEQRLISALGYITGGRSFTAAFLTGHGEYDPEGLRALFSSSGLECESLNLRLKDPEPNCGIIVVCAPTADISDDEAKKLAAFMSRGGGVAVLLDTSTPPLDTLEAFLAKWGVRSERAIALDPSQSDPRDVFSIIPAIADHAMTAALSKQTPLLSTRARPISAVLSESGGVTVSPLLVTSEDSYSKKLSAENPVFDRQPGDVSGPFIIASVSSGEGGGHLLLAPVGLAFDDAIKDSGLENARFFTEFLRLTLDGGVPLPSSAGFEKSGLSLLAWQARIIVPLLAGGVPLLVAALGAAVCLRRRRL